MPQSIPTRVRAAMARIIAAAAAVMLALVLLSLLVSAPLHPCIALVIMMAAVLGVLGIAAVRTARAADKLSEQTQRVTQAALEIAGGDLHRSIAVDELPIAELRALAEAINATAQRARADIAEMKRLERVRSEFLGNVSHELRTPIFSVEGYLETLLDGAADDPAVRDDFLYKAHQNVRRLHSLLADLIEISRIESGEMKMSFRYFDAVEYLRSIVDEMGPTADMAGVRVEMQIVGSDKDRISVYGDRDRLKQAIVNLVGNAIKYNRPAGTVTVEIEQREHDAVVRVRDTGIGIPQEDLARIFERFYRVNKDRSRAVGGSGLGLAIVKHIVEAHGSQVQVESELGVGTTFSITLKR